MKLLVVSQYFWPESFRINDLVRSLVGRGHKVDVLTGKPNYPEGVFFNGYRAAGCQVEIWEGASVYRVPLFPRGEGNAWRLALNYFSFVLTGFLFSPWLLRRRKYDVVFVYGLSPILAAIPAIFLAWIKRRKLIVWVQDLWPESLSATGYVRNPWVLCAVKLVVRWIYRRADLLLVQSRAFVAPVAALTPGGAIVYYPNSVDATFFEASSSDLVLPDFSALNEGFAVVFAGNLGKGQAVEVLVEAAALLVDTPEIRLIVFGRGSRWKWMREQTQCRGLTNLHLPGRVSNKTMPSLMRKAAVLLVTLADQSIFAATVPNKMQAYFAVGRPIVACLNGEGARLLEESGAGFAVPAEDAQGLADAILKLYRMLPEERERLGANGKLFYKKHFDHEKLVSDLIRHLQRTISS
jgi:glycosyltransferase involved in cell wall biosynthesis